MSKRAERKTDGPQIPAVRPSDIPLSPEIIAKKRRAHLYLGRHGEEDGKSVVGIGKEIADYLDANPQESALILVEAYQTPPQITRRVHQLMRGKGQSLRQAYITAWSERDNYAFGQTRASLNQDNQFLSDALTVYDNLSRTPQYRGRLQVLFEPFPPEQEQYHEVLDTQAHRSLTVGLMAFARGDVSLAAQGVFSFLDATAKQAEIREDAVAQAVKDICVQNDKAMAAGGNVKKVGLVAGFYGAAHTRIPTLLREQGMDVSVTFPQAEPGKEYELLTYERLIEAMVADPSKEVSPKEMYAGFFTLVLSKLVEDHNQPASDLSQSQTAQINALVEEALAEQGPTIGDRLLGALSFGRRRVMSSESPRYVAVEQEFTAAYAQALQDLQERVEGGQITKNKLVEAALQDNFIPVSMDRSTVERNHRKHHAHITDEQAQEFVSVRAASMALNTVFHLGLTFAL